MSNTIAPQYECCYCSKNYKIRKAYDKHVIVCSIFAKSKHEKKVENEEIENLPTMRELYGMIKMLMIKNEKLERQVSKMNTWINNKKRINVVEWLNENNRPEMNLYEWIETIEITNEHMEYVFNHNFVEGVNLTVREIVSKDLEKIPIKAFDERDNALYVYNGEERKWELISQEQFERIFVRITKGLMNQLKFWQDRNKDRLFQNGFTEKYIENVKKITGGNLTREQQHNKLKLSLYNSLKVNIKNVVQYEFEF